MKNLNIKFTKLLDRIPPYFKPTNQMSLVFYIDSFDPKTRYELRNINPPTLADAFKEAQNIENNRHAFGKVAR